MTSQYKTYLKYKDLGIDWIGEIPEGWRVKKIKYLCSTVAGGTPSTANLEYWDGDIPWLPSGMVHNNVIGPGDVFKFITLEGLNNSSAKKIRKDSPLIALTGATCGNIAYLTFEATANQSVVGMETNKKCNAKYLYYYLISQREQILINKTGGAQSGINEQNVKDIVCALPDISEQTTIANYLDKKTVEINKLIEKDKKLIELLKEKRTALINHAVKKGLTPNVKMKDSGIEWISEIPEGWEVRRLRFNALVNPSGKKALSNPKTLVNFLPMEKVSENGEYDHESEVEYQNVSTGYTYFEDNDVLVAKITPCFENGKGTLVNNLKFGFGFGTTEFHIIRGYSHLLPRYLFYLTKTHFFRVTGEAFMKGTAGQKRVSADFVKDFMMVTPPKTEQLEIVRYLDKAVLKIDKTTQKIEQKIALLEEYKKSLIHHVVTGKVDVREV